MAFWKIDLTTEDGAIGAAQLGGFACFIAAGLTALGLVMMFGLIQSGVQAPIVAGTVLAEIILYLVAGFRLRAGRGVVWGSVAAVLLLAELVLKVMNLSIVGIVLNAVLLIGTVNGIRGALALRRGVSDAEDAATIFE